VVRLSKVRESVKPLHTNTAYSPLLLSDSDKPLPRDQLQTVTISQLCNNLTGVLLLSQIHNKRKMVPLAAPLTEGSHDDMTSTMACDGLPLGVWAFKDPSARHRGGQRLYRLCIGVLCRRAISAPCEQATTLAWVTRRGACSMEDHGRAMHL